MGLPEWDTVRLTIEGNHGLEGTAAGQELLDPNTAELWIASRVLDRTNNHTVADRLGRNEKTKVIFYLFIYKINNNYFFSFRLFVNYKNLVEVHQVVNQVYQKKKRKL